MTLEKILKQKQKIPENAEDEEDEEVEKFSFFKKNKRKKPVKYDITTLFAKSGLNKNTLQKWYYPVNSGKTSFSSTTPPTTTTTTTTAMTTTTTSLPTSTEQQKEMKEKVSSSGHLSSFAGNYRQLIF